MSNSRPPWTRVPNLTKSTQLDLGIAIVSTRKGGVVDRSAFSGLFPDALTSERTTVSPLDCIQEGVCRTFSKRDLRSAPSLESVDGGGLSSRGFDGFDRFGSLRVTPCAREWRLNGVSMADMAGYPLLRHGGDQANDMTVRSPHSSACMPLRALRFRIPVLPLPGRRVPGLRRTSIPRSSARSGTIKIGFLECPLTQWRLYAPLHHILLPSS